MASFHFRPKHISKPTTRPRCTPYVDINEDTGELDRPMRPNSKLAVEELMKDSEVEQYQYSPVEQVFMGVLPTYNPSSSALASTVYDEAIHLHYTCKDCGDKFLIESSLKLHKARTTVSIEYNCVECARRLTFYNRCNFLSHLRQHNLDPSKKDFGSVDFSLFPLPLGRSDEEDACVEVHEWVAEVEEQNSNCSSSTSGFASECRSVGSADVGTTPVDVGVKPARRSARTCPECNLELTSTLPEHYWGEDGQTTPRFECKQCSQVLPTRCCLEAHVRIHNLQKPYICPECCIVFLDWVPFWSHVTKICFHFNRVISYGCQICQHLCETVAALHKHISVYHTENDVYFCEHCNNDYFSSGFPNREKLKEHFAESHKIKNPKRLGLLMEPSKRCQVCEETVLKRKYIAHVLKHCTSSRCYAYGCENCKGAFTNKYAYERHKDKCLQKTQQTRPKPKVPHKPQPNKPIGLLTKRSRNIKVNSVKTNVDKVQKAFVHTLYEKKIVDSGEKTLPVVSKTKCKKIKGGKLMKYGIFHCNQCNEVIDLSKESVQSHTAMRHNNIRYVFGGSERTETSLCEDDSRTPAVDCSKRKEEEEEEVLNVEDDDTRESEVLNGQEEGADESEVLNEEEEAAEESEGNEDYEEKGEEEDSEVEEHTPVGKKRGRPPGKKNSVPTFHPRKSKRKGKANDSDDSDYEPPQKVFVPSKKKYVSNRLKSKKYLGSSTVKNSLKKKMWRQTAKSKPSEDEAGVVVKRKPDPKKKVKPKVTLNTDGPFSCLKCPFSAEGAEVFKEHVKEHRTPNDFQCMECGMCFVTKPSFNVHLIMIHKIKDVEAYIANNDCCDLEVVQKEIETPTLGLAVREEEIPTVLSENQCSICHKVCDSALNLSNHFRTHGMAYLLWKKRQGNSVDADS